MLWLPWWHCAGCGACCAGKAIRVHRVELKDARIAEKALLIGRKGAVNFRISEKMITFGATFRGKSRFIDSIRYLEAVWSG